MYESKQQMKMAGIDVSGTKNEDLINIEGVYTLHATDGYFKLKHHAYGNLY